VSVFTPPVLPAAPTPIVRGRDAELAALGEQLDRVHSSVGAVVLVEGSAGMGKSRLLEETARAARRLSFRVGSGAAEPSDRTVPLGQGPRASDKGSHGWAMTIRSAAPILASMVTAFVRWRL
jgi:hypothetical protein